MIFPVFASVVVFCIWLAYEIRKSNKKGDKAEKAFWAREAEADKTRKMPLDDLHYIIIPDEIYKPFLNDKGEFIENDESFEKVFSEALTRPARSSIFPTYPTRILNSHTVQPIFPSSPSTTRTSCSS